MVEPNISAVEEVILGVSDFVALLNQSLEYIFPSIRVVGELANFRVSKNRWVYFDLKDDESSVKCFGTVYQLSGPLEDGMLLEVQAQPRLHNLYGFSLNVHSIHLSGEGTIKRASQLLAAKLEAEGLFAPERKRPLPYPPRRIALVASGESAAYGDFLKVVGARWGGLEIIHADVQVQGDAAPAQIVAALQHINALAEPPEVIVMTRGGGSPEDLMAFSDERVVRAVAASRIPTLAAIGHEVDVCLVELAADVRASTPSNAAELLVPDRRDVLAAVLAARTELRRSVQQHIRRQHQVLRNYAEGLTQAMRHRLRLAHGDLQARRQLLDALSPQAILARGYAVVRQDGRALRDATGLQPGDTIDITFAAGRAAARVEDTHG